MPRDLLHLAPLLRPAPQIRVGYQEPRVKSTGIRIRLARPEEPVASVNSEPALSAQESSGIWIRLVRPVEPVAIYKSEPANKRPRDAEWKSPATTAMTSNNKFSGYASQPVSKVAARKAFPEELVKARKKFAEEIVEAFATAHIFKDVDNNLQDLPSVPW